MKKIKMMSLLLLLHVIVFGQDSIFVSTHLYGFDDICNCNNHHYIFAHTSGSQNQGLFVYKLTENGTIADSIYIETSNNSGYTTPILAECNGNYINLFYCINNDNNSSFQKLSINADNLTYIISTEFIIIDKPIHSSKCFRNSNNNLMFYGVKIFGNLFNTIPFIYEINNQLEIVNQFELENYSLIVGLFEDKTTEKYRLLLPEHIIYLDNDLNLMDTIPNNSFIKYFNSKEINNQLIFSGSYYKVANSFPLSIVSGYAVCSVDSNFNVTKEYFPFFSTDGLEYESAISNTSSLSVDSQFIFVGGTHQIILNEKYEIFIHKLDTQLNVQWVKSFGGDKCYTLISVKESGDGGCFAIYYYNNTIDYIQYFEAVKFDADGNMVLKIPLPSYNQAPLVYPNPFTDKFILNNPSHENTTIKLYNSHGQLLQTENMKEAQLIINTEKYPKGMYLLQLSNNKGEKTVKVVKE